MGKLNQKVAVVTGGNSGIGLAICDTGRSRSLAIIGSDAKGGRLAIRPAVSTFRPGRNRCLGARALTALRGQARLS